VSGPGIVYLVGAGPGDPGLITVRGLDLLRTADVVVHDRLIAPELLAEVRPGAKIVDVGKTTKDQSISQEAINALLVQHAQAGSRVVRLKGGDPYVFGRGFEELDACRRAGIDCIVVSGVTSAVAGPAAAGIPVTHRQFVRSFAVFSAHAAEECAARPLDYGALAKIDTVVVLMGREKLAEVTRSLIAAGRDPATPAACIEQAATRRQRVKTATLATIAAAADRDALRAPIVTVIGEVARLAGDGGMAVQAGLAGKKIAITRPRSAGGPLRRLLSAAGATPISFPMIRVVDPPSTEALDDALRHLDRYQWTVFTSAHGVRFVWRRLAALGLDTRSLGSCRVAAVGPATAHALRRRGVVADLVPQTYAGEALVNAVIATMTSPGRILCPRSDIAPRDLPERLRQKGAVVDEVIAYQTEDAKPSEAALNLVREGVEAIVFCSPSAIRRFVALGLQPGNAAVACIGPTTAAAARESGMRPDVVAQEHTADGLVAALEECFVRGRRGTMQA